MPADGLQRGGRNGSCTGPEAAHRSEPGQTGASWFDGVARRMRVRFHGRRHEAEDRCRRLVEIVGRAAVADAFLHGRGRVAQAALRRMPSRRAARAVVFSPGRLADGKCPAAVRVPPSGLWEAATSSTGVGPVSTGVGPVQPLRRRPPGSVSGLGALRVGLGAFGRVSVWMPCRAVWSGRWGAVGSAGPGAQAPAGGSAYGPRHAGARRTARARPDRGGRAGTAPRPRRRCAGSRSRPGSRVSRGGRGGAGGVAGG